jgi:hypothetical protein
MLFFSKKKKKRRRGNLGLPELSANFKKENARILPVGSLTFSQFYVKHNLRKNKIIVASTTDFFKH